METTDNVSDFHLKLPSHSFSNTLLHLVFAEPIYSLFWDDNMSGKILLVCNNEQGLAVTGYIRNRKKKLAKRHRWCYYKRYCF